MVYFLNFLRVASYMSGFAPNIEKLTCQFVLLCGTFLIIFPCIKRTGSVVFVFTCLLISMVELFLSSLSGYYIEFQEFLLNCWCIDNAFYNFYFLFLILISQPFFTYSQKSVQARSFSNFSRGISNRSHSALWHTVLTVRLVFKIISSSPKQFPIPKASVCKTNQLATFLLFDSFFCFGSYTLASKIISPFKIKQIAQGICLILYMYQFLLYFFSEMQGRIDCILLLVLENIGKCQIIFIFFSWSIPPKLTNIPSNSGGLTSIMIAFDILRTRFLSYICYFLNMGPQPQCSYILNFGYAIYQIAARIYYGLLWVQNVTDSVQLSFGGETLFGRVFQNMATCPYKRKKLGNGLLPICSSQSISASSLLSTQQTLGHLHTFISVARVPRLQLIFDRSDMNQIMVNFSSKLNSIR